MQEYYFALQPAKPCTAIALQAAHNFGVLHSGCVAYMRLTVAWNVLDWRVLALRFPTQWLAFQEVRHLFMAGLLASTLLTTARSGGGALTLAVSFCCYQHCWTWQVDGAGACWWLWPDSALCAVIDYVVLAMPNW
jgi:hypothetical protein